MFLYHKVSKWLDSSLAQKIPDEVMAFALTYMMTEMEDGQWNSLALGALIWMTQIGRVKK